MKLSTEESSVEAETQHKAWKAIYDFCEASGLAAQWKGSKQKQQPKPRKGKSKPKRKRKGLDASINLPRDYAWKVLGWLSSDLGWLLTDSEQQQVESLIRNRDFEGYLKLSEAWGLQSITSRGTALAKARAKYQLSALLKKFRFPTDKDEREQAALVKFYQCERACESYNNGGFMRLSWSDEEWMINAFTYARSFISRLLGQTLPGAKLLTEWSRHGPGATLDTKQGGISLFHKFDEWPYSVTIDAYRYARFAIETDARWFGALQNSYRRRFNIPKQMPLDMRVFWSRVLKVVEGNRITFVPKSAVIERTIAIEPTMNLYLQLGVDGFIRRRLKRWGVDLDSQTKNQRFAYQGSLHNGADSFCTIDLAGASDSVSLKVCELLLPPDWYAYLLSLRSPVGDLKGEVVKYEKISSMGNGYTFALESLIFTAVIFAVIKSTDGCVTQDDFAVFGDDLIVRRRLVRRVMRMLEACGFAANHDKSFTSGPVRESCGADWFQGKPMRPVFLDEIPTDVEGLWTDVNRLQRILSLRWGLEKSKCCTLMDKWIPKSFDSFKGPFSDEDFDSYRHVPKPPRLGLYKNGLYRYRRRVRVPIKQRGANDLHIRKLMNPLRPSHLQIKESPWSKRKAGKGSAFDVTRRNAVASSSTYSVSDIWTSTYTESGT